MQLQLDRIEILKRVDEENYTAAMMTRFSKIDCSTDYHVTERSLLFGGLTNARSCNKVFRYVSDYIPYFVCFFVLKNWV